jgi:hypothetical protein
MSRMDATTTPDIHRTVLTSLEADVDDWADERFEELALAVFRWQYGSVAMYRAWCDHELAQRGESATDVTSWRRVPALPIAAFKRAAVSPALPSVRVWHSSGTTGSVPSRHHVPALDLYDASLRAGSRAALCYSPGELLVVQLAPSSVAAPSSSLAHMFDAIRAEGIDGGAWVDADGRLDGDGAWTRLKLAEREEQPALVLSTSIALAQLLEHDSAAVRLPGGSRVVDTGGSKGRTRSVSREALLELVESRLGVPAAMVENEYGMSELSSQAWLGTIARSTGKPLRTSPGRWQPPWFRTRVVDPQTLEDVADGGEGLLVHHDLANAYTCAAIRSEDWGRRCGDSYELLGRAPGAELRGCSLQIEDVL